MKKWYILFLGLIFIIGCSRQGAKTVNNEDSKRKASQFKIESDTSVKANFTDKFYGFKVWFPTAPQSQLETLNTQQYQIIYQSYYVDLKDSFFMVTVVNYPLNIITSQKADKILLGSHSSALKAQHLISDYEQLGKFQSYPALFYKARNEQFNMVGVNFLKGRSMYQVFLVNTKHYPSEQTINRFLGSFQLLPESIK